MSVVSRAYHSRRAAESFESFDDGFVTEEASIVAVIARHRRVLCSLHHRSRIRLARGVLNPRPGVHADVERVGVFGGVAKRGRSDA